MRHLVENREAKTKLYDEIDRYINEHLEKLLR